MDAEKLVRGGVRRTSAGAHDGLNRSNTERTRVVIVYVSDPGTPFLDPVQP